MPASVIVWDIETVPDLRGFAAANGVMGRPDDEVRAEMGEKFPKLIYHSAARCRGFDPRSVRPASWRLRTVCTGARTRPAGPWRARRGSAADRSR